VGTVHVTIVRYERSFGRIPSASAIGRKTDFAVREPTRTTEAQSVIT